MTHNCPYYPCHKGLTDEEFDCEYCYCPVYKLKYCGGNFKILPNGVKDCSDCTLNHTAAGKKEIDDLKNFDEFLTKLVEEKRTPNG